MGMRDGRPARADKMSAPPAQGCLIVGMCCAKTSAQARHANNAPSVNTDPALLDDIRVVAETARWVVIDKPAGVLSVPGKSAANRACAASWCRGRYPHATGPITVHRLDMDTSGLLLMALDAACQRLLSEQFEQRAVEKMYVAVVRGRVHGERGTVSLPMRPDLARRPVQVVDRVQGREAITEWRVVARETALEGAGGERTRLELLPRTGRTHQLRVHCAFVGSGGLCVDGERWCEHVWRDADGRSGRGHPIVGDVLYSAGVRSAGVEECEAEVVPGGEAGVVGGRLLLHAARLVFTDPASGERVRVESAAPF